MATTLFRTESAGDSFPGIDIPSATTANIGDVAFDQTTGQTHVFQDVSQSASFSYAFNGNSAISVDSSVTSFFDSTKRFSNQFSTFIETQNQSALTSYNLNNVGGTSSITSANPDSAPTARLTGDASVVSFSPFAGNSFISDDSQPTKEGSIFLRGAGTLQIDSAGVNFKDSAEQGLFTVSAFNYDIGTSANQPIASTPTNSLVFTQEGIIQHGIKHKLIAFDSDVAASDGITDSSGFTSNGIMPSTALAYTTNNPSTIKDINKWQHNTVVDDGYDISVFKQGVRHYAVPNPNQMFNAGELSYKSFRLDKDAAFSANVFFPSSPSANATLFTMGNDTGNVCSVAYTHSGQTITFTCRQLSFAFDAASLFTNVERVVKWDIRINPGRIRLFVDGELKGSASTNSALTNHIWAEGLGGGVLEVINPSGITYQQAHYVPTNNTLVNAASIVDGDVTWNSTLNDVGTFFLLNNLIGNNKTYYFEMEWTAGNSYYGDASKRYYTQFDPYIVNSGWDGSETYPNSGTGGSASARLFPMFQERYYGTQIYKNTSDANTFAGTDPITNKYFMLRMPGSNGYLQRGYIYSFFIDFTRGIAFNLINGQPINASRAILRDTSLATRSAHLGISHATYHTANKWLPSYALNETTFKLAFGSYYRSNYAPSHVRGVNGNEFIRSATADVEIRFNSNSWKYDPVDLILNQFKPFADNVAGFMGSGVTYPTTGLPVNGVFASSDVTDNWFTSSGTYKPLKYFPETTFESFSDQTLRFGQADLKINPKNTNGSNIINDYIAKHSGNIISLTGGGNITSDIQGASDNDAIKLGPGTYTINAHSVSYFHKPGGSYTTYDASSVFLGKKILICGDTNDPSSVIINYIPYYPDNYHSVYAIFNGQSNNKTGLAFCKLKRDLSAFNHNRQLTYQTTIHYFSKGGFAQNVIFDFTDADGTRVNPYPGFHFSYDDQDLSGIINKNRSFSNVFFIGYTRSTQQDFAATYSKSDRLSLHNIAYDGPVPTSYEDDHTGYTIGATVPFATTAVSNVIFTDSGAEVTKFNGYINGPELRRGISFDSTDFRNSPLLSNDSIGLFLLNNRDSTSATSARSFQLKTNVEKKQLLRIEDDGKVFVAKDGTLTQKGTFAIPTNAWTHVSLSWDPATNTAKLRKNGADVDSISNFFDSHFIGDASLIIGGGEDYTAGIAPDAFEKNYLAGGNSIKDFELSDSDITNDSVPTTDFTGNSKTRLLIGNDDATGIDAAANLTTIGGPDGSTPAAISGNLFSPYAESDRKFFVSSISNPSFTAAQIGSIGNATDEIILAYPDSYARGSTDSPDLNILLTLAQKDAGNQNIEWTYVENNSPRRAIIGHDSAGYKFQIKKFKYDSVGVNSSAFINTVSFTFNASRTGQTSLPTMLLMTGSTDVVPMAPVTVIYDMFGAELFNQGMLSKYVSLQTFDSDANQLLSDKIKFIYDSYPHVVETNLGQISGSSVNISDIVGPEFEIDSLGALP